jgi:hypothetical protein
MRVFGTRVRLGKVSKERVLEGLEDGANLRAQHDGAVELLRGEGEVFIEPSTGRKA